MTRQSASAVAADAGLRVDRNPLDRYTQYQPYFRFFMVSEPEAMALTIPPADTWTILAETGGSGLTSASIESVELTSFGGMDKDSGLGVSTEFEVEILQAFQAGTLLDTFWDEAARLGIHQPRVIPLFLELTFRVRDPESQDPLGWQPLRDYRWVWPVLPNDVNMEITSQGTKYHFKMSYFGLDTLASEVGKVRHQISIKDVATVGDLLTKLAEQMTKPEKEQTEAEYRLYRRNIEYTFEFDEEIGAIPLKPHHTNDADALETRSDLERGDSEEGVNVQGEIVFSYPPGHSVEQIIIDLLLNTEKFQASIAGNSSAQETLEGKTCQDEMSTKEKTYFRILQDSRLTKWNPQMRAYDRKVTYKIVTYKSTMGMAAATDPEVATTDLGFYAGRLRRVYEYLFTGVNNSVIDFDLRFNFHWFVALPFQGGMYQQAQLGDPGPHDNLEESENREETPPDGQAPEPPEDLTKIRASAATSVDPQPLSANHEVMRNRARNLISVLFEEFLSPTGGDMINVEMEIKGDPFWLEPDPMPDEQGPVPTHANRAGREPTKINNNTAYGHTYYLFVARGGQPPNNDGTWPAPGDETIISGVFAVKKVVHHFKGSKFTQTLHAYRDTRFNADNIQVTPDGQVAVTNRPGA